MNIVKTLNKTEYEWLLSGDKNTNESLYANLIHFTKLFWQAKYDVINSTKDNLEIFIVNSISQVPEVEYILISKIDNYYEIWIVINKSDREVRGRIYDIEYDILERVRGNYFDFHVICRDDRNIDEICPTNTIIYYRKEIE